MADQISIKIITVHDVEQCELAEQTGREIIKGEWAERNEMAGIEHGLIAGRIFAMLFIFLQTHKLGTVYPDSVNYVLEGTSNNIIVMRIPDVSFVATKRVERNKGYYYLAPA